MKRIKPVKKVEPKFFSSVLPVVTFVMAIWLIKLTEVLFDINFASFGLYPQKFFGLAGIFTSPLIHGDFNHLISNSFPLFLLGISLFYFYPTSAWKVIVGLYILPGVFVWFFGRASYHIGASGIIYGLVTFFFFSGVIRRDKRAISLALIVTFLYGGLVWGILPIKEGMSWESHLFGAIWGIIYAFIFRKSDPYYRYEWEKEEEETPVDELEISYDKEDPF